jgi:hypothetical protein
LKRNGFRQVIHVTQSALGAHRDAPGRFGKIIVSKIFEGTPSSIAPPSVAAKCDFIRTSPNNLM